MSACREFAIGVDATFVRHGRGGGAQQMLERGLAFVLGEAAKSGAGRHAGPAPITSDGPPA